MKNNIVFKLKKRIVTLVKSIFWQKNVQNN